MSAFVLDIKGQLNNMRLAESKALWPLFEAQDVEKVAKPLFRGFALRHCQACKQA